MGFSPDTFSALCDKFAKNRDQMHFHASVKVGDDNKLVIHVDQCDEVYDKYIPTMRKLLRKLVAFVKKEKNTLFKMATSWNSVSMFRK